MGKSADHRVKMKMPRIVDSDGAIPGLCIAALSFPIAVIGITLANILSVL